MKVIRADRIEALADYREIELPLPEPGPGQVRIAVAAVGVGYVDALVALGRYQVKPPLPHVPGSEIAGRIDAVGAGVEGLAPGDRVVAMGGGGGFAEYALLPAAACLNLPDAMTFAAAAAFPLNYLTVLHGLHDRARLRSGETLLVMGAAGGVGSAAVQVGKAMGARVITVASTPEKRAFALSLGADAVLDTDPDGWRDRLKAALAGAALDVVIDPVCGPLFEPAFRSLGWGGRHLVAGFAGGKIPALPSNLTLMKGAALIGVDVRQFQIFEPEAAKAHMATLLGWVASRRLDPPVGRCFGWQEAGLALEFALSGKGLGKTVLLVGDERVLQPDAYV
jgi:NADPH2:quinone reductase